MSKSFKYLLFIVIIVLLASCASVDFDYPKSESTAYVDTHDTHYGKLLKDEINQHPSEHSGFFLLNDGIDALSARLLLAEHAQRSIDAQYYEIKKDIIGRAFITALLQAADRGVRVRLLIDDINTVGYDIGMAALDSHPNFEIRVFNPFVNRTFRKLDALGGFSRINRRMHNKSFTVDNQITIFGGRNIGDEYFGAGEDATFFDLDVAAIGPIVKEVSNMFNLYWNHERAAPLPAFTKIPEDPAVELSRVRENLKKWRDEVVDTKYAEIVKKTYLEFVENQQEFTWAPYQLVYDSPDKAFKNKASTVASITTPIRKSLLAAEKEILVVSPYFVPKKKGIDALSKIQENGVNITVITNSHAANNQALVHAGYAPARKPLLKNGIKIYEVKPTAQVIEYETIDLSSAKATLHTKAYIVDREKLFIGSFNFDQRSANINTELGAIIHSPQLASLMAKRANAALAKKTYELFLSDSGGLRWRAYNDGQEVVLSKEPHTSWWQRVKGRFLQMLPIKDQL
jgi:putative cardiolipin synthase